MSVKTSVRDNIVNNDIIMSDNVGSGTDNSSFYCKCM